MKKSVINPAQLELNVLNAESGLNIQFIQDGSKLLTGFKASYRTISGYPSLVALIGNTKNGGIKRLIGYYGEFIVLEAVSASLWLIHI